MRVDLIIRINDPAPGLRSPYPHRAHLVRHDPESCQREPRSRRIGVNGVLAEV